MAIHRQAGLKLLLIVAAALGCSLSVLSATGPAIDYSAATTPIEQARG